MRLCVGVELGEQMLARRVVELAAVEDRDVGDAARKPADLRAAVAEHHAAGAVAVDQRIDQRRRGGGAFARVAIEQREQIGIVGKRSAQARRASPAASGAPSSSAEASAESCT